jgi:hypothetical protein
VSKVRALVKRHLPGFARQMLIDMGRLSAPPLEDLFLHEYEAQRDLESEPRLTLVIPSIAPEKVFGGLITGIEIFLEIGKLTGARLRVLIDEIERESNASLVDRLARKIGLDPGDIEIVPRREKIPKIPVALNEVFIAYNFFITLNVRNLVRQQAELFGVAQRPYIYIIQDYEPQFYPFSTTHLLARLACDPVCPYWGIFNSSELHAYFRAQGHSAEREFVFEPKISDSLRPFLQGARPAKQRRILVYGRPYAPRNCFPAIEKGLSAWARAYPEFSNWEAVSAGQPHESLPFAPNRALRSLGKLSLDDYGDLLKTTAVGISLMSSPHPSYPPLEMAHFGVRTITNGYANKNLGSSHDNIISLGDILPETIAEALARACREFEQAPESGWSARSHRPSYLSAAPFPFLKDLAEALRQEWAGKTAPRENSFRSPMPTAAASSRAAAQS